MVQSRNYANNTGANESMKPKAQRAEYVLHVASLQIATIKVANLDFHHELGMTTKGLHKNKWFSFFRPLKRYWKVIRVLETKNTEN